MSRIVIAGGTGFVGKFLSAKFRERGDEVMIVSRKKGHVSWSDREGIIRAVDQSDLVINLAGRSVNCRYNEKNRREILESRMETTRLLGQAISACKNPPPLWINAGTATIYRHAQDRPMTEAEGETGSGFSVDVARQWEESFFSFSLENTRQVVLRMAIVLGKEGGVMEPLKRLTRFGLGGKQGRGDQMFSWVHIEDVYRIILFLMDHEEIEGIINCSSPNPVSNEKLMQAFRHAMHVNVGLPAPAWLLEWGAVMIRTETELILKSRWVLPRRLLDAGFTFTHPLLGPSLQQLLSNQVQHPDFF